LKQHGLPNGQLFWYIFLPLVQQRFRFMCFVVQLLK